MRCFVGYLERKPYLWFVDLDSGEIEPASDLRSIPQGIDDIVPIGDCVAVRCGPVWFGLPSDLKGEKTPLDAASVAQAARLSAQVDFGVPHEEHDKPELALPTPTRERIVVTHPVIRRWGQFATWSPTRTIVAMDAYVADYKPDLEDESFIESIARDYEPESDTVMAWISASGDVRVFAGTFDGFCYPPAWSVDESYVAFGAPFEGRRLYVAHKEADELEVVRLKRNPPMPLIDCAALAL